MSQRCQQETHAPQQFNSLFNHLVGPGEQVRWDSQIHRAGGLQVDAEYDAGRLDEGQFGDLGAAQQAVDVARGLALEVVSVEAVHQQCSRREVVAVVEQELRCKK
jgi:hypothetical protein